MATASFHWVHKDIQSNSLSSTSGLESKEIRRFVQHQQLSKRRRNGIHIRWQEDISTKLTQKVATSFDQRTAHTKHIRLDHPASDVKRSPTTHRQNEAQQHISKQYVNTSDDDSMQGFTSSKKSRPFSSGTESPPRKLNRRRRLLSYTGDDSEVEHLNRLQQLQSQWRIPRAKVKLGSGHDPFNSTAVSVTDEAQTLISYYSAAQANGGNAYKLHLLPPYLDRNVLKVDQIIQSYLENYLRYQHAMWAMMAFMAVRLIVISKVKLANVKSPQYYMQQAIHALRKRLLECEHTGLELDLGTIGAIHQIALADWTAGDLETARIHLKVHSNLVQYINHEHVRGRFMIESIRTLDLQVALETGELPHLPAAPSFEPMPPARIKEMRRLLDHVADKEEKRRDFAACLGRDFPPPNEILADCDVTLDLRLGTELEAVLATDILSPSIKPTIRNVLDCLTVAKVVWRTKDALPKDARCMCRTARTMVHHLWTYGWDRATDSPNQPHKLTDCVRLTLIILLTLATNRMASRAVGVLGKQLFAACGRLRLCDTAVEQERKLYLWTLLTAILVAKEGTDQKNWLLHEAAIIACGLDLTSYEALHEAMTEYIYSWTMQKQTLQEVVKAMDSDIRVRMYAAGTIHSNEAY